MNAVVTYDPSVPAFLRNAGFLALNQKAAAGLSTGAPPRISFRGSRLRFIGADGTETPVTENNGVALDVIVLDASDHVSKFYYDKAYDPNADDMSPACFSDNGQGPSQRAAKPQNLLCGACPQNVWGSKVTPQGSQVKACSDVKKVSVIPVSNVDGPAYALGIPGASLKTWSGFVATLSQRGIPIPAMVVRIGFDATAEFPKLTFTPMRWLSEQEAAAIQDLFGSDELSELVGRKDVPITAMPGAPANVATQRTLSHQQPAAAYAVQQPAPVFNVTGSVGAGSGGFIQPTQQEPIPAFLERTGQQQPMASAQPTAEAPKRRRGRPPAVDTGEIKTAAAPVQAQAPAAVPADLNALLDSVMGGAK